LLWLWFSASPLWCISKKPGIDFMANAPDEQLLALISGNTGQADLHSTQSL
jgi:hypothetical protein